MQTAKTKVKIDTSNMIVFAGGSFSDVYRNLREKNIKPIKLIIITIFLLTNDYLSFIL